MSASGGSPIPKPDAILKLVLTGGPCGGKTTALDRLSAFFRDNGFRVYTVPEAATLLLTNGVAPGDLARPEVAAAFQHGIIKTQMQLEDALEEVAKAEGVRSVLLADRGLMDGSAYIPKETWEALLQRVGMDVASCREARYHAVFHLVSAAIGAEEYYTLENNEARFEPIEAAREQDLKTQGAWLGHPHHYVYDNSTGFEEKLDRLVATAARIAGLPYHPGSQTRKFLLAAVPDVESIPVSFEEYEVDKVFLKGHESEGTASSNGADGFAGLGKSGDSDSGSGSCNNGYTFVQTRRQGGVMTHSLVQVELLGGGSRRTEARLLSARECQALLKLADPGHKKIVQRRISFLWEHQSYSVHIYQAPISNIAVLRVKSEGSVRLPTFLPHGNPIAEDENHSAFVLSKFQPVQGATK
ncbi:unnamed protein product [Chrysoparadoxa australica]